MKTRSHIKDKVSIITLGCSKNLVDSEELLNQLAANDIDAEHQSEDPEVRTDANIIIINTCGFIDRAKEESVNTLLEYGEAKKAGQIDKLYATGCLSQRYREELSSEIPEVDACFAAATAVSTSPVVLSGVKPITSSVAGFIISKVSLALDLIHSPFI